jgi:hypothetical protein
MKQASSAPVRWSLGERITTSSMSVLTETIGPIDSVRFTRLLLSHEQWNRSFPVATIHSVYYDIDMRDLTQCREPGPVGPRKAILSLHDRDAITWRRSTVSMHWGLQWPPSYARYGSRPTAHAARTSSGRFGGRAWTVQQRRYPACGWAGSFKVPLVPTPQPRVDNLDHARTHVSRCGRQLRKAPKEWDPNTVTASEAARGTLVTTRSPK